MSLTSRHPLRKSCSFCRARKIKCSNETICEACRKHNVDCIYFDADPPRPKARTVSQDNSRTATPLGDTLLIPGTRKRSSTSASPGASPPIMEEPGMMDTGMAVGEDVATALEKMFFENFSETSGPRSNPWQERINTYHQNMRANGRPDRSDVVQKLNPKNVKYTGILPLLTHDLVGLVVDKFGALGCHHVEGGGARFFLSGLEKDDTQAMFDSTPPGPSPLSDYGNRQITQMIDVWFSVHPLSFLVSKTLLLRELRDGTHDEILLATILADANFSIGDDVAVARGHVLLRWAALQLRHRPLTPRNGVSQAGMPAPGISIPGISTAQALMLLGWNAMCHFELRRASCYIGLSGRLASQIKDQISSAATPMTTSRINGIDVFEVEKELVAYLWWTTYSIALWTYMQMGHNFSQLLPTSLTSIFLPVDETSSVVIRLDEVSDNFSTLQKQKAMIREMWPLAHISSIIAYIYALYPKDSDLSDSPNTQFWQEAPLLALQRIQQGTSQQDISSVCREVYRVLMDSIHLLNRQVAHAPSRALVLVVYHTMGINMLFPHPIPGVPPAVDQGVTPEIIERFYASAHELINIFHQVSEQTQDIPTVVPSSTRASFPDIFCLALDTCGRSMTFIFNQIKTGAALVEPQMIKVYEERLEALASRLHVIAQSDFLTPGASVRAVKKQLKGVMRALGGQRSNSGSSAGSPENSRRPSSHVQTPPSTAPEMDRMGSLSTATTAVVDSTSTPSFVSPRDTTKMLPKAPPTAEASPLPTPFNPFSPEPSKIDWQGADEIFHHVMDQSALGTPTTAAAEHLSMSDLVDLHASWFPGNPMLMEFDMNNANHHSLSGRHWDWPGGEISHHHQDSAAIPASGGADMDSMLYYFERGGKKGTV